MLKKMIVKTPIGALTLAANETALVALHLPASEDAPPDAPSGKSPILALAAAQLREYFAGERRDFDLPLAPEGTAFQRLVWDALLAIPYGVSCSYGDIAKAIRRPAASRAVGAANGRNPIAIIVPCHRVIGSSGALIGYGGGLPTKQWLLAHEQKFAPPPGGQQRLFV